MLSIAIKDIFPTSKRNLCAWHIQQNLKKKFCFLNRSKKNESQDDRKHKTELYQMITNLPFLKYEEDFEEDYANILADDNITKELKNYLKEKVKQKELWVKAFIKTRFCAGMCTSSRIEAKHKVLKLFLNSSKRLSEIFDTFKALEYQEISKYFDEIIRINKGESQIITKYDLVKELKKKYSPYCLEIVKNNLIEGLNYSVEKIKEGVW